MDRDRPDDEQGDDVDHDIGTVFPETDMVEDLHSVVDECGVLLGYPGIDQVAGNTRKDPGLVTFFSEFFREGIND